MIPSASSPPPGWGAGGIDDLLSAFEHGRLSEIVGPRSSGGSGLLMAWLARATASDADVALVDGADTFDPAAAADAGVDLARLLWVRCGGHQRKAWNAADLLARCQGFAVALDLAGLPGRDPAAAVLCLRLRRAVEQSGGALVLYASHRLAGSAADLVVEVRRRTACWHGHPRSTRLGGLVSEARIVRSRAFPRASGAAWSVEWRL